MGVTTYATASQKGWVEVECERCSTRYSCLVEGYGQASDTILPASDDTLRDAARYASSESMKRKAAAVPCPKCGTYGNAHVEKVERQVGRIVFWPSLVVLTILLFAGLAAVAPKTPAWVLLIIIVVAWIAARILANVARRMADPNQQLDANRRLAQERMARGTVRMGPPA
jgi:hypothetical protein